MGEQISLHEVLVKSSYLTQITKPNNKNFDNPIGFGSGFIVLYDNVKIFVTADHTIHIDDYNGAIEERTGNDYVISIFNNYANTNENIATLITPLSEFYYMDCLNLNRPNDLPRPIDVSVCVMKDINLVYPFFSNDIEFLNGEYIKAGQKFAIDRINFAEPIIGNNYLIFGHIRTRLVNNIRLESQPILKENLKFISKSGDFFLFNTPELITDSEDWEGLSGSPVFNDDGYCIGVFCDILINSNSIWVMPISIVDKLIQVALLEENRLHR